MYKQKQRNKINKLYMSEQFEMIAKTFQGLEEILAEELTTLGANDIQIGRRMVSFTGDKRMMYKANFCLRTAIRILKPIKNFTAKDADEVYNQIQAIPWEEYLDVNKTFAIDAVVFSEEFRHSKFVSYKVKDAIVDYFREKTGKRPSVRINNPDVLLNIHIAQTTCTLSLDSSGESLHRRGYRQEQVEAPLNEVLAAGMVLMTGWRGECDLIDPMCGSGTIPIEAALIARNIAPGVFRKGFAFEKWVDFDSEMFDEIYNDDSQEREFTHKIYGYDNNPKANEIATKVGLESAFCAKYLKVLLDLGILKKETPITEKAGRKTVYAIGDNFFRFWYRFVPQNASAITAGRTDKIYDSVIKRHFSDYMGLVYEQMCKEYLFLCAEDLPIILSDIGQWWGNDAKEKKEVQIDIVGTPVEGKEYIIGSCKYRNEPIGTDELELLKHYADVFGKGEKYHYYIFSKSGFTKGLQALGDKGEVKLITLQDMYE